MPSGGFEDNPICWDIINEQLITLPLFTDSHNQTNATLFYYSIDTLVNLFKSSKDLLRSYAHQRSRCMSTSISPFDIYNNRIYYRNDTLRGRLFIDFTCSKDSFLFYIYIENLKLLEKWQYTPFSRLLRFKKTDEKPRPKAWVQISKTDINLSGPFRAFSANNNDYLIDKEGRILKVKGDTIRAVGFIERMQKKILVFDKDNSKLLSLEKSNLNRKDEILSIGSINKNSKVVIDFNQ